MMAELPPRALCALAVSAWRRLKALPEPTVFCPQAQDVERGVMIPVEACPAFRALVPPNGQAFPHQHAAARTGLRGERRRHGYGSLPSVCCFGCEEGAELAPASITDALGEVVVLHHVGRLQVFVIDRVVLTHQRQRRLVVEVGSCPPYPLMRLGEQLDRLSPAVAALLPPRHPPLGTLEVQFSHAEDARVGDLATVGQRSERLQPEVDTRFLPGKRNGLAGHLGTGERHVPGKPAFSPRCTRRKNA